jgi:hypothetical protein
MAAFAVGFLLPQRGRMSAFSPAPEPVTTNA